MKAPASKPPYTYRCLFLFLILTSAVKAQINPEKLGFESVSLKDEKLGMIHYYHSKKNKDRQKPVLLYLDGSGPYPLFQYMSQGFGSTIPFDLKKVIEDFHVVLISKPGVPFADSVGMDPETGYPHYQEPEEYTRRLSLDWRVGAAERVLKDVLKRVRADRKKIAILGFSEGFQAGAALLARSKLVTHAVLMVGNGFTQFFDFIIQNRQDAICGKISQQEAQANIDSLQQVYKNIMADPASTTRHWFGHTYLRWSSFASLEPFEILTKVKIPVYLVGATADENTSVLGLDYIRLKSELAGKSNLIYHPVPYDHGFNEVKYPTEGRPPEITRHMDEVMQDAIDWLRAN